MKVRPRMFSLAALLTKREPNGSVTIRMMHGHRNSPDGEGAATGAFAIEALNENPGFALEQAPSALEFLPAKPPEEAPADG